MYRDQLGEVVCKYWGLNHCLYSVFMRSQSSGHVDDAIYICILHVTECSLAFTKVCLSFESSLAELAKMRIKTCVSDIDRWMLQNLLKLSRSKTELLVLNAKHRPSPPIAAVAIGDAVINPSKTAQNISAVCDSSLSVEEHVKASCKSAFFHLSNIAQIWKHLPTQAAETLIHSFVTSKVDFCNSLLYGVPNQLIRKLQSIQNSVARLLTYTNKQGHIKPVLKQLHWLPVEFRIQCKILLMTFKCLNDTASDHLKDLHVIHSYTPHRSLRWQTQKTT